MNDLLTSLAHHGGRHLGDAEADLAQLSGLLQAAIEELTAQFLAIQAGVRAQQALLDAWQAGGEAAPAAWQAEWQRIAEGAQGAIVGLQFQDMAEQLIAHASRRLLGLRELLESVAPPGTELAAQLSELHRRSEALSLGLQPVVQQRHMACGEVELF